MNKVHRYSYFHECHSIHLVNTTLEHDQLFYLVYERMQVSEGNIAPHVWTFRSKITLENLTQKVQEKRIKDQHPILYEFLLAVGFRDRRI